MVNAKNKLKKTKKKIKKPNLVIVYDHNEEEYVRKKKNSNGAVACELTRLNTIRLSVSDFVREKTDFVKQN